MVCNPCKKRDIAKIEGIQNSFTRKLMIRIHGFVYDRIPSPRARNRIFGLQSLMRRRRKFYLIMFHKIMHGNCGLNINEFCVLRSSITRGGPVKLILPRARSKYRAHYFSVRAGSDYLRLSKRVVIPANIRSFKAMLDSCLSPQ